MADDNETGIPLEFYQRAKRQELEAIALGTDNQRERYAAGLLPEDELLAIARHELFKPFDGFKRWRTDSNRGTATSLRPDDVKHSRDCQQRSVGFETTQAGELGHDEWVSYRQISAARDQAALHSWHQTLTAVRIEPMTHWATCATCKGEAAKSTARISIEWAGRVLVREYAL